jgi:small glutamine-rich tetratricopeptide repeat-containing protein alpha
MSVLLLLLAAKSPTSSTSATFNIQEGEKRTRAEEFKQQANNKLKAKYFAGAIACYSDAIALVRDPIYFSNRAAAYSEMRDYESAIKDCQEAT